MNLSRPLLKMQARLNTHPYPTPLALPFIPHTMDVFPHSLKTPPLDRLTQRVSASSCVRSVITSARANSFACILLGVCAACQMMAQKGAGSTERYVSDLRSSHHSPQGHVTGSCCLTRGLPPSHVEAVAPELSFYFSFFGM